MKRPMRLSLVALCCGLAMPVAVDAKKTQLEVWHALYGGWSKPFFDEAIKQFEKLNPGIQVNMVGVDVSGEKFLTSAAAGAPPDVIFPDGPQVVQWAYRNLLMPLDKYVKSSKMDKGLFWEPAYTQGIWKGQAYSLPWIADGVCSLVCSKAVLNDVGLSKPPEGLEELELFAKKITKADAQGNYSRVGYLPYSGEGNDANSLFTHGWMFGGEFSNEKTHKVTLDDPKIVATLDWMVDYAKRYNYNKLLSFYNKYAAWGIPDPLAKGRLGMGGRISVFLSEMAKLKMSQDDFLYGFTSGPADGVSKSAWIGGWTAAIPANAKHRDEAWKFIKFICYDSQGLNLTYKITKFLPAVKTAECFKNPEPAIVPFVEVLKSAKHHRPVTPVTPVLWREMEKAMVSALKNQKSARQALTEGNDLTQRELTRILAKSK